MSLKTNLGRIKSKVDSQISRAIPRKLDRSALVRICGPPRFTYNLKSAELALHIPIWDLLGRGGKRWRPALFLLVAQAYGARPEKLLPYSVIPEIIHNGTLMADDVEDNSDIRRGKPAIHKIYGADVAINASSAMYFLPLQVLRDNPANFPPKTINSAYSIYAQEMINLAYGQGFDIIWHKGRNADISEGDYLQMCAFKTGTLARMAARLGALFAGASSKNIYLAGEFAESIGIAFQIQDDILNLTASEAYGKEIGGDISEGKRSLIALRALEKSDELSRRRLLKILNSHTKDLLKIGEAISIIRGTDALEYSANKAKALVLGAWKKFSKTLPNSRSKLQLEEFADYMIYRKV
ncbi:MAG: polyprenyl synthetase family protein [Candidatus Micrarchaeota archaeon]